MFILHNLYSTQDSKTILQGLILFPSNTLNLLVNNTEYFFRILHSPGNTQMCLLTPYSILNIRKEAIHIFYHRNNNVFHGTLIPVRNNRNLLKSIGCNQWLFDSFFKEISKIILTTNTTYQKIIIIFPVPAN